MIDTHFQASQSWTPRHTTAAYSYAVAFFLCMALAAVIFLLFIQHGWALVHVPNVSLPSLSLPTPSTAPPVKAG